MRKKPSVDAEARFYQRLRRRLRTFRLLRGVAHDQMAALLGVTRCSYTNIESGHQVRISLFQAVQIAKAFGMTVEELL